MHLATALEVFGYRLGTAVTMERDTLDALGVWERTADSSEVRQLFTGLGRQAREHVGSLLRCFEVAGLPAKEKPCPTAKGISHEGSALRDKVDPELADLVLLGAASAAASYAIASYASLRDFGGALALTEVARVLERNLADEQAASGEIERAFAAATGRLEPAGPSPR